MTDFDNSGPGSGGSPSKLLAYLKSSKLASLPLVLMLCSGVRTPALSQSCIDYRDYIHWAGELLPAPDYRASDVAISGSYAFSAEFSYNAGSSSLVIADVSEPAAPVTVGTLVLPYPGEARRVAVRGPLACITHYSGWLMILDVSNPSEPAFLERIDVGGGVDVVLPPSYPGYAFVTNLGGLVIIDVSNPAQPSIVSSVLLPGYPTGVDVEGSYAYVSDSEYGRGLQVVDISDVNNPVAIGGAELPGRAWCVDVSGSYAYVGSLYSGLHVLNVSVPGSPVPLGSLYLHGPEGVTVRDEYAYVADAGQPSGLKVVDISDPKAPQLAAEARMPQPTHDVAVGSGLAILAVEYSGLQIIDTSNPLPPPIVQRLEIPASCVAISGGYAYAAGGSSTGRLTVVSLTLPITPIGQLFYGIDQGTTGIGVERSTLCITRGAQPMLIVDVADPAFPTVVGQIDTPGYTYDVEVGSKGTIAYVADGDAGLAVIDLPPGGDPVLVGSVDTPGWAFDVDIEGTYAFIAANTTSLVVVDISDPTAPVIVADADTPGWIRSVAVEGSYACVGDHDFGLGIWVIDISDPLAPTVMGHLDTGGVVYDVAMESDIVYVAGVDVQVVDVSDPALPVLLGGAGIGGSGLAVNEPLVCLAADLELVVWPSHCHLTAVAGEAVPFDAGSGLGAYPNPARYVATFGYRLREEEVTTLGVYDVRGRLVRVIEHGARRAAGEQRVYWDGRDSAGIPVAGGLYLVRLSSGDNVRSGKIVLIR